MPGVSHNNAGSWGRTQRPCVVLYTATSAPLVQHSKKQKVYIVLRRINREQHFTSEENLSECNQVNAFWCICFSDLIKAAVSARGSRLNSALTQFLTLLWSPMINRGADAMFTHMHTRSVYPSGESASCRTSCSLLLISHTHTHTHTSTHSPSP